jgi:hypothetical protein
MKTSLLITIIFLASCWNVEPQEPKEWTEDERQSFSKECSQKTEFEPGLIILKNFELDEMDSIKIFEIFESSKTDSLILFPKKYINHRPYLEFTVHPQMTFSTQKKYQFQIGNTKPYVLENMKMIMWAQFTQNENWTCIMGDYTIDEIPQTQQGNIKITKR